MGRRRREGGEGDQHGGGEERSAHETRIGRLRSVLTERRGFLATRGRVEELELAEGQIVWLRPEAEPVSV
jgi:hypothetical protein